MMNSLRDSFPPSHSPPQDITIEAEGGLQMTYDDSLRASLGPVGDPMFVSTGRRIRKHDRDLEDSLLSSQMSLASAQSTSSLGILHLDSMGDLSASLLQADVSLNPLRFSDVSEGRANDARAAQGEPQPGERGRATGVDSISSEIDTEDELEAVLRDEARRALYPVSRATGRHGLQAGDGGESSSDDTHQSRPGLEGGSSDEYDIPLPGSAPSPRQELSLRQSAEGGAVASFGGGAGDGMSDGETESSIKDGSVLSDPQQTPTPDMSRLAPHFLLPLAHPPSAGSATGPTSSPELRPLSTASSFHFEEGMFGSSQEGLHQRFWSSETPEGGLPSPAEGRRGNGTEDDEDQEKTLIGGLGDGWSTSLAEFEDFESEMNGERDTNQSQPVMGNLSRRLMAGHSPQGAHNPFDSVDSAGGHFPPPSFSEFDGEFTPLDDAEAVLDKDQKEFEKEHKFRQDEHISSDQFSSEWTLPNESRLTVNRPASDESDEDIEERVSLGEFMRTRTEALGSLSGDYTMKRPSFGTGHIKTPEAKDPVALVEMSRLSLVSEEHENVADGLQGLPTMTDLGESIRFAGVGSDTEDPLAQDRLRSESASQHVPQLGDDSSSSFAELDGYSSGKPSLPMDSLYFRAANPEGSASDDQRPKPRMLSRSDSDKQCLCLADLCRADGEETSDEDSRGFSRFIRNEAGDVEDTIVAETPDISLKASPPKPNLRVQPFQEATPMPSRQILRLRDESEPDGTRTPPIATSSIAAAIISASSCTKPEELAAMIVALSNKNRKQHGGQAPKSNRAEADTRPKPVDAPSSQAFPNRVHTVQQLSPRSPRGRYSMMPSEGQASHVPREAMASKTISTTKPASESHDGRTQPSGTDSEPQRSRGDNFLSKQPIKSKSLQVVSTHSQQDIQDRKSEDPRLRSTSKESSKPAQLEEFENRSQETSEPLSKSRASSQTIASKSAEQINGNERRESNESSVLKEMTPFELSFDSRIKVHYQCVEMLMRAQDLEDGIGQAGTDSDAKSPERHRYSQARDARHEDNVVRVDAVRGGYSSDEESNDASRKDRRSGRPMGKDRRKQENQSKSWKADSDTRNGSGDESILDPRHPIASPTTTLTANKSSLSTCSGSSSLSESATQTSDDDTRTAASAEASLPPPSVSYGPPITSFQAFPNAPHATTCVASTTPTLLTGQSLLTDALLKQYLNEQAVTSRPPNTLSVAPSYVSGQLMRSLDAIQSSPTAINVAPPASNLGLTQTLAIHGGTSLNQLQSLDPSYPSNTAAATHPLFRSTRDLGPMLDRVSVQGQVGHLDGGVPPYHPYPTSATMPVMSQQPDPGLPGFSHLSATGFAGLPGLQASAFQGATLQGATLQGATVQGYPVGALSRPGTAQEHGPPQPARVSAHSLNPAVVSTVNIKDVCCLGIAKHALLPLQNTGPRWLQCHLKVASINLNGEELPAHSLSSFLIKRSTIIAPHHTEDVKVVFVPHQPGSYVAQVLVSASPVVAEGEVAFLSQGSPVTILARAEKPNVEIKGAQNGTLDFGVLSYGKERSAPVYLVNKGYSTVPLRIHIKLISQTSSAWHSFYLHAGDTQASPNSASGLNLPTHVTLEGQNDEATLMVHFRANQRDRPTSSPSGSPVAASEQILAKLEVWLDVPDSTLPIASAALRATVGLAKLNIPRSLTKEICLRSKRGEHSGRMLPLKNTGTVPLHVELEVASPRETFTVVPTTVLLAPNQEVKVMLKYAPKEVSVSDTGVLTMCALPDGPSYEVILRGEVGERSTAAINPNFLVNRHYISWGGVPIGRTLQQKLTIRSCCKTATLTLKLCISGNKRDFQLLNTFDAGELVTDESQYVTLHPLEDLQVHILFSPSAVATSQAKLNIKPQGSNFKYTVPLSGYGGVSKLIVETGQETEHHCYSLDVGRVSPGRSTLVTATISNVGRRCAFVKALVFQDEQGRDQLADGQLQVDPSEFLLPEGHRRTLTLTLKADSPSANAGSTLAAVGLFYGDELTRQLLRRALRHRDSEPMNLSENNPLRGINFDGPIPGEAQLNEACDLPWRSGDLKLFYRCISRLMVHLKGSLGPADPATPPAMPPAKPPAKPPATTQVAPLSPMGSNGRNARESDVETGAFLNGPLAVPFRPTFSPPVKGTSAVRWKVANIRPKGPSPPTQAPDIQPSAPAKTSKESWTLRPLQLVLTAPSASTGVQNSRSILIANLSVRQLRFETMHTPDCLIVTPAAGVVEPGRELLVLVSCNPSIQVRGVQLPWRGTILVICDGQKKEVRVQIREDLGMDTSIVTTAGDHTSEGDVSSEDGKAKQKELSRSPDSKSIHGIVLIDDRLVFNQTKVGEKTTMKVQVQNTSQDIHTLKFVSPHAPFSIRHKQHTIQPNRYIRLPVSYKPTAAGRHQAALVIQTQGHHSLLTRLEGVAV